MPRALRIVSVTLITAGLVVLADVGATLAWKEPLSSLYSTLRQAGASDDAEALEDSFPEASGASQEELRRQAARLAARFEDELRIGHGIGRIRIPAIGVDYAIVEGTDSASLQRGPGHYPKTALPGQGRTIGIAGHRTTYMAPFRKLDRLEEGDEVIVEMPYADLTYRADQARVVEPTQTEIVRHLGRERLVLTACHPLYSAAQRYAVFAELETVSKP